jgi:hypothetical protein
MLAEVAGKGFDLVGEANEMPNSSGRRVEPGVFQLLGEAIEIVAVAVDAKALRKPVGLRCGYDR